MDDLRQKQDKGLKAKQLLENETLQEAFAAQEQAIINQWKSSEGETPAFREGLWLQLQGVKRAKECLEHTLGTGKDAERKLVEQHKGTGIKRFFT